MDILKRKLLTLDVKMLKLQRSGNYRFVGRSSPSRTAFLLIEYINRMGVVRIVKVRTGGTYDCKSSEPVPWK